MEEFVGMKERYREANASKCLQITSQSSIDFPSNNKNEEAVKGCDHFSIRGYVAGIRNRAWETCWPFSPPGEKKKTDEQLANALPPLDIPKFRFWNCQKCVQPSDASDNAADVSSLVLETICIGRKDAANTLVDVSRSENGPTANNSKENRDITMHVTRGESVNLNLEACTSFGFEVRSCGIAENGVSKEGKTWQNLKNTDFLSLNRRKFSPYVSSDDEEENIHKVNGHHSDRSQISSFKANQKFRSLSSILREEKAGVSPKVSNSKTKIVQTKTTYQSGSLVLYDQTAVRNCTLEENKKRKAHEDRDHDLLPVRCAKSVAKSCVYRRENDNHCSHALCSNGESHFPENAIHGLVSQNQLNDKKTLLEERANYINMGTKGHIEDLELPVAYWGLKNKKAFKEKGGMSLKQKKSKNLPLLCNSKKKKNQSNDRANKMGQLEDLNDLSLEIVELLANSRHKRRFQEVQNDDQIKSSASKKSVDFRKTEDISRLRGKKSKKIPRTCKNNRLDEIQMLQSPDNNGSLASSSYCLSQSDGTQLIELSAGAKVGDQVHRWAGDNFLKQKPIPYWHCGKSHSNNVMISCPTDMQGSNHVLKPPCACTHNAFGYSAKQVVPSDKYANRYMPATELLQLMDAGMCPKTPQPEKLKQTPIQKTDFSKNQIPFSSASTKAPSKRDSSNFLDKDHSNLGMCYPSNPIIHPIGCRNEESKIMASNTVKSAMKKGKNSCGNEDLGNENDPFFADVMPLRSDSLSLEHRLTFYPVSTLQHIHGDLGIERCSMNRNAADFTVPGPGNQFMIGCRELKLGRMGRPRKGIVKLLDLNEHAPN